MLVCLITSNCIYVCCIFDLFINLYHAVAFFAANKDVYNVSFQVVPGEHERLISIIFLCVEQLRRLRHSVQQPHEKGCFVVSRFFEVSATTPPGDVIVNRSRRR